MAGGKPGDEFNSQMHRVKDLLARTPDPEDDTIEDERQRARERNESLAFELRLLGNTMVRIERCQTRIRDEARETHQVHVDLLKVMREIRDHTGATAQESPHHQSIAVSLLVEIKDMVQSISLVAMKKLNGH